MKHTIILNIAMLSTIAHGAATSSDKVKHDEDTAFTEIVAFALNLAESSQVSLKSGVDEKDRHPLLQAAKIGDLTQIQSLVAAGTPITTASAHGSMAIHFAAENGHHEPVGALIANFGVHPDVRGAHEQTAAHWAARNGHISVLAMLKKYDANMNAQDKLGRTPLYNAVLREKIETIRYLLDEAGTDPFAKTQSGANVLHLASLKNLRESTAHLLERKIFAPDIRADNGATPLHYASDSAECAKLLLEYGCDKDARDLEGCTTLLAAVSQNNIQVIESLLAHGASVSIPDNDGITPMHIACANGFEALFVILLKHNAEIDPTDNNGTTPLILAAGRGHYNLVATLIASGANINAEAKNGITPILAACQHGHDDIILLLSIAQEMQTDSTAETSNSAPSFKQQGIML